MTWYFHLRCGSTGGSGCYMYIIRSPVYCVNCICIAFVSMERSMEWVWNKILSIYGMFSLRQLVEKRLEKQGHMALAFVDLKKSLWHCPEKNCNGYTLRWMGAQESEVKMVEAMYENTKARVVVRSGMSNEFQANIGLIQGSALSPLLFIFVMELISRKISTRLS